MTSIQNIDVLTADRSSSVAVAGDIRGKVQRATVRGRLMQAETLTVDLAAGANTLDAIRELNIGQVLDPTTWNTQYAISRIRRNYPDVGGAQIEAKAFWERLKYSRVKRTYSETRRVDRVFSIYKRTPANALSDIMESAPSGFAAGSTSTLTADQQAALVTLSLEDDTHWRALEKLCDAIKQKTGTAAEFYFTRSGDTYLANIVQQVGISGNRSVKAGGGDASSPSNRLDLSRVTHGDEYFSRLSAVMGDEAENITLGRDFDGRAIHWDVESIALANGEATLTLSGEPVPYDDWGVGSSMEDAHFFGNEAEGFHRITDSTYPNTIVVRTGSTAITDGFFASDSQGTALDFIKLTNRESDFGVVEKSQQVNGVPFPNLIRQAGHSDDMEAFAAGVPVGFSAVGSPTIAQISDERYAKIGTYACQVQADITEGLRSSFYTVRGGLVSVMARIAVEAGEVQIRLIDSEGNSFPGPQEGQAVSSSRALQQLNLGVWNGFEGTVAVEILATKPNTVYYLDALTLTPSNGSYDWAPIMGGREMWAETGRILALEGGSVYSEYAGASIDLSEVTGINGFDAFELGALITIQDGYREGVHDINVSTRVVDFEKSIIGEAQTAKWTAERVREDLVDFLRAGKPVSPRPLPQSPVTPRYAPRLAVEREDVADAGGGMPGVKFTLFPKTAKNETLENWEIFVSVDAAEFASIGTDEDALKADPASVYFVGGGYMSVLGETAQPTYSVVYPADDGSVKSVRFYVENRSTGLDSEPLEFLVRNPELAATQITGTILAEQLIDAAQSYGKTFEFASVAANTVTWGAGTITFAGGNSYNINAGSTGVMAGDTYIYLDTDVSTTELQASDDPADLAGNSKTFLAFARPSLISQSAFFIDARGRLNLTNEQLAVDSVDTNQLRANSITGVKIAALTVEAQHIAASTITADKLAFTPITSTSTLDDLGDGVTYARVLSASLSAGEVLLSAAFGTLDDIADGTYSKVLTTSVTAGKIVLSETEGDLDDVGDGATYAKVRSTILGSGYIQVGTGTKDTTLSGWFWDETELVGQASGVDQLVFNTSGQIIIGSAATGIVMSANGIVGNAASVEQVRIRASDGKIVAGAGSVTLDVSGVTATAGAIGGWALGATTLTGGSASLSSTGVLTLGTADDVAVLSAADATYRLWAGNATAASAPFSVTKAGSMTATLGSIAGWDITSDDIAKNNLILDSSGTITAGSGNDVAVINAVNATYRLYIGHATAASAPFSVTKAGAVTASDVTITGGTFSTNSTSAITLSATPGDGFVHNMGVRPATKNGDSEAVIDFTAADFYDFDSSIRVGGVLVSLTGHAHSLDNLSDVAITAPATGEVLKYDGAGWVNDTVSAGVSALDDLSDVTITTPGSGHFLRHNGTGWVNIAAGSVSVSSFNNDAGYTSNTGDITSVTAGAGLSGGGTSGDVTLTHADTSTAADSSNSGATVIQSLTFDTYGHVLTRATKTITASDVGASATGHTHDDRYYTETELNTSGGAGQVHWNRITSKPAYVDLATLLEALQAETIISGGFIATSYLTASNITAGTLNASVVAVTNLNASNISTGTLTSIAINNGSGTFSVDAAGALVASSATITGAFTASGGAISVSSGGLSITSGTGSAKTIRWTSTPAVVLSASTGGTMTISAATIQTDCGMTLGGTLAADGATVSGNAVWHAGNDGASSGLDADLLDGSQGSAYAKLAGTETFTGAKTFNASTFTVSSGTILFGSLPSSDPAIPGQLYRSGGAVMVSL